MKKSFHFSMFILIIFVLWACSGNRQEEMVGTAAPESATKEFTSSSAAIENPEDSIHQFIRKAELKFKVKNVVNSTYDIETTTLKMGGFVTYTNLSSSISKVSHTAVSSDSTLETTEYVVSNSITVRVPNTKLDTTLMLISRNIEFLDYRIISADDVALKILANTLTQKRAKMGMSRINQNNNGNSAVDIITNLQSRADDAMIANLALNDQIQYSTIQLSIYQRESLKRELIANNQNIKVYEPGFGRKLWSSIKYGWHILEAFVVFIIKLWGIILFLIIVYIIYRQIRKNKKKVQAS